MNAANLVIDANTNRDLETRLAAQGVLSSTLVSCNDLQAVKTMAMDAQVDQLVIDFQQQLPQDCDIIEINLKNPQQANAKSAALSAAHLKAARIVASSETKQQHLLVSVALEAATLNIPQHKLHHLLLSAQAQGADFVTVGKVADVSVAKRLVIASQTVDVPVTISLDQQALLKQGQCALALSQTLYQEGAAAVGIDGYIGPQNTDQAQAHSWLSDKRGSLYIH